VVIVSTHKPDSSPVLVYPVPASEELFIKGINGDFSYAIIDLLGKEILHDHSANNSIQTRTLSEGLYLLKINKDKHTYLTKFIISREE